MSDDRQPIFDSLTREWVFPSGRRVPEEAILSGDPMRLARFILRPVLEKQGEGQ